VSSGVTKTPQTYNGVDLVVIGHGPKTGAMAITGDVMLVGDDASVKAAIDSKGSGSFASNERFAKSQAALTGEGLGYVFLDGSAYVDWLSTVAQAAPSVAIGLDVATNRLIAHWFVVRLQPRC